jgi:hypothetical protein
MVTVMSALRLAWTTHGVTHAAGISSPEISAVAPAGVVAMEMFSVVPRVIEAQPTHGAASATANSSRIIEGKSGLAISRRFVLKGHPVAREHPLGPPRLEALHPPSPAVTF